MNGEELREVLRSEMAATVPPPPLSTATVLGAARRARARRRTAWACAGSAVAVLVVAGVGAVGGIPGAEGFSAAGPGLQILPRPSDEDTAEPWPTGPDGQPQEDRTARAGTRYDQGVRLLDEIVSVVPDGYTAPENPPGQPAHQMPLRSHQAQFEEKVNGVDVWSYLSSATLTQGERRGRLLVEVHTTGNLLPSEPCVLARQFWGMGGRCEVVPVGAARVGVVVQPAEDDRLDQWAAYRHSDGTVVFVAQGSSLGEGRDALPALPFSVPALAALAVDDRFRLE